MLPILIASDRDISGDNGNGQLQQQQQQRRASYNERDKTHYQAIPDKVECGPNESEYPIKDDEPTTYCTSKHPKINFFFFTSFYVIFLVFGAIIFLIIEQPREVKTRDTLIRLQENFLVKYPQVKVEDVKTLLEGVLKAHADGYYIPLVGSDLLPQDPISPIYARAKRSINSDLSPNNDKTATHKTTDQTLKTDKSNSFSSFVSNEASFDPSNQLNNLENDSGIRLTATKPIYNWRFSSSLLFVTSLVTTIGYGNLTPLTDTGKLICIIFCIIGVPATLTFFSTLVTLFVRGPVKRVEAWIIKLIIYLHRSASVFTVRILHLVIITTILLCLCLIFPAYFFYLNEAEWSYLESFYCCFISLTTIGLGDFVPGINGSIADLFYPIVIVVYLFFGLSMIMVWLALIHRIPQLSLSDALVADEKEEDKAKEEEDAKARERLRMLTNQLLLQQKLNEIKSIRLKNSTHLKVNQSVIP